MSTSSSSSLPPEKLPPQTQNKLLKKQRQELLRAQKKEAQREKKLKKLQSLELRESHRQKKLLKLQSQKLLEVISHLKDFLEDSHNRCEDFLKDGLSRCGEGDMFTIPSECPAPATGFPPHSLISLMRSDDGLVLDPAGFIALMGEFLRFDVMDQHGVYHDLIRVVGEFLAASRRSRALLGIEDWNALLCKMKATIDGLFRVRFNVETQI